MTPINPTQYVLIYAIVIFVLPWGVFITYLIRVAFRSHQLGAVSFGYSQINELAKKDPKLKTLYTKSKRWLIIVFTMWLFGSFLLILTLYLLDNNNLLVNHNKGASIKMHSIKSPNKSSNPTVLYAAPLRSALYKTAG